MNVSIINKANMLHQRNGKNIDPQTGVISRPACGMKKTGLALAKVCVVLAMLFAGATTANAQSGQVALKTNLLYDATTTPNLGLEVTTGRKQSAQVFYGLNPWKFDNGKKIRHWLINPEYRWWFCHTMNGSFIGVHALGGEFNAGGVKLPFNAWPELEDHRYEGWYVGGGVSYGYQWPLSKHWNFEAAVGVGYVYIDYKKFECGECGTEKFDGHKNYFGPTKLALSLMYLF